MQDFALSDLAAACRQVFSAQGRLSTAIPGFSARAAQMQLAEAIAESMAKRTVLVAEAGTGTGKTFAYLIPGLLSGKKLLISTATNMLQDQLYQKDLPLLKRALGLSTRVQNLKGRTHYLCLQRIHQYAEEASHLSYLSAEAAHELLEIREKIPKMKHGDRSELPEISEQSSVWPWATATKDNCLGSECAYFNDCFLQKARRRALKAQVVIINHHLFFADSKLKEEGFGELLPNFDAIVFDEAHQLAEIAATFQGRRFSTYQIHELLTDLQTAWPADDWLKSPLLPLFQALEAATAHLASLFPQTETAQAFRLLQQTSEFRVAWDAMLQAMQRLYAGIAQDAAGALEHLDIKNGFNRLLELQNTVSCFVQYGQNFICWAERYKHSIIFHATPVDVSEAFSALMAHHQAAFIFTSATLTMAGSFEAFTRPLGLQQAKTLLLSSPFDYGKQALLYLPRGMPDPKAPHYYEALLNKALPIMEACGGKTFILFTSRRALKIVAQHLSNQLKYPLLIQGEEAKDILLARFRAYGNAILLGTASFWEGVDVKGEALSCVIIDKLPFSNPWDPVIQGKTAYLQQQGLSAFDHMVLPEAVLALKQGVGRLIRDDRDKGILMLADPRLTGRAYGAQIFASLPPLKKTRDLKKVLNFIQTIHEAVHT